MAILIVLLILWMILLLLLLLSLRLPSWRVTSDSKSILKNLRLIQCLQSLLDLRQKLLWVWVSVEWDATSIRVKANVLIRDHLVHWVIHWVLTESLPDIHHFANIEPVKSQQGSHSQHVTPVLELLKVLRGCLVKPASEITPNAHAVRLKDFTSGFPFIDLIPFFAYHGSWEKCLNIEEGKDVRYKLLRHLLKDVHSCQWLISTIFATIRGLEARESCKLRGF